MNPTIIKLLMGLIGGNQFTKEPNFFENFDEYGRQPRKRGNPWSMETRNWFGEGGLIPENENAHDNIDALMGNERLNQIVQDLVMGLTGGGGAGKGIRQLLLLMKGKIKGGKMIPSQPFRHGSVTGKSNPSKLDIVLNRLKDNPNVGGHLDALMKENVRRYKK